MSAIQNPPVIEEPQQALSHLHRSLVGHELRTVKPEPWREGTHLCPQALHSVFHTSVSAGA